MDTVQSQGYNPDMLYEKYRCLFYYSDLSLVMQQISQMFLSFLHNVFPINVIMTGKYAIVMFCNFENITIIF